MREGEPNAPAHDAYTRLLKGMPPDMEALWREAAPSTGGEDPGKVGRLLSEAKKFSTESDWTVVNHAMQILGCIGDANIFPVERLLRDVRLITIWTGTNESMNLVIQHEYYKEPEAKPLRGRDVEMDAAGAMFEEEKVYG